MSSKTKGATPIYERAAAAAAVLGIPVDMYADVTREYFTDRRLGMLWSATQRLLMRGLPVDVSGLQQACRGEGAWQDDDILGIVSAAKIGRAHV